jgi:hypothetical protein
MYLSYGRMRLEIAGKVNCGYSTQLTFLSTDPWLALIRTLMPEG